jgi:hypothetical protein
MSQLETVIYLDPFLQDTLHSLQAKDVFWQGKDVAFLRNILHAEWRSAGVWRLMAEDPSSDRAMQASQTWSEVIARRIRSAVEDSRRTFLIDQQMQSNAGEITQAGIQISGLNDARVALRIWKTKVQQLPANQPLNASERWYVLSLVAGQAKFTPVWTSLLGNQPTQAAGAGEFIAWADQIETLLDETIAQAQQRLEALSQEREKLAQEYATVADSSLGLSPNLEIQTLVSLPPRAVRLTSANILVGSVIGLLVWALLQLFRISDRVEHN